jgi:hypothetical protein
MCPSIARVNVLAQKLSALGALGALGAVRLLGALGKLGMLGAFAWPLVGALAWAPVAVVGLVTRLRTARSQRWQHSKSLTQAQRQRSAKRRTSSAH